MFDKILVANRGEIACRILRTARRMGIRTVAVYSDADAQSPHVRLADEARRIGPPPARDSYLSIGRIIEAARATGAAAIHPGYGFLSENDTFAEACHAAGIVFVGPSAHAIRAMGDKSAAKALMAQAGVPLVPGYHGDCQDDDRLRDEAARVGYPVLIKASAGGGGKGMRVVAFAAEFDAALAGCRREAIAAFGDGRVLVERYLQRPRHIEVQVFGDRHGQVVHLFERDCSVQRRHQKVLEEAPAPGLNAERRATMGHAAVEAARAIGYEGAGTVEFIVDEHGAFHFMEMNTRLQVEHPVTEMITGLDLVEWQLRVAAGEPLPLRQEQIDLRGHAIEARIYAEDVERGFLPSTGRLERFVPPAESLHVRVDAGVEQGGEVTPHYDPMLAKLIVWDVDRDRALARMRHALAEFRIVGVTANLRFLSRLVASPAFARADLDTGLIERERAFLFDAVGMPPRDVFLVAALSSVLRERRCSRGLEGRSASPWGLADGWRLNGEARRELLFRAGEVQMVVAVRYRPRGYLLNIDGVEIEASGELLADDDLRVDLGGRRVQASVVTLGERRHVHLDGGTWELVRVDPLAHGGEGAIVEGGLQAPMPGRVVALLSDAGADVAKGAPLLVLEAMKMEHTIHAPAAGRVNAFRFQVGEQVDDGAELVDFTPQVSVNG